MNPKLGSSYVGREGEVPHFRGLLLPFRWFFLDLPLRWKVYNYCMSRFFMERRYETQKGHRRAPSSLKPRRAP